MKKSGLILLACIWMMTMLTSCTTSRTIVSSNVNLAKYKYVSIINNDTYHIPAELMEYEIQLFDAVENSGLTLVADWRIYELSQQEQSQLLLAKYGVNVSEGETIVTVNFIDYLSGRPVASCRGVGATLSYASDIKNAIKNVGKQISETFPR